MRSFILVIGLLTTMMTRSAPALAQENVLGLPATGISLGGSLVIGGGGRTPEAARAEFIRLAGGRAAHVVLIPSAYEFSSLEEAKSYFSVWLAYPVASLDFVDAHCRQQADSDEFVRPLRTATGVWMPGGSQVRLIDLYGGTLAEQAIRQVLQRGGVVGGTSAGAAVLSRVMILEGTNCDAVLGNGFGLLESAVVDQHFSQRGRHARLLNVLEDHPGLLGLGIDEDTALVVQGNHLRVLGDAHVTVFVPTESNNATVVYRLKPGAAVELSRASTPARELPVRVALRQP
jgi:cyanophycinase